MGHYHTQQKGGGDLGKGQKQDLEAGPCSKPQHQYLQENALFKKLTLYPSLISKLRIDLSNQISTSKPAPGSRKKDKFLNHLLFWSRGSMSEGLCCCGKK